MTPVEAWAVVRPDGDLMVVLLSDSFFTDERNHGVAQQLAEEFGCRAVRVRIEEVKG